MGCGESDGQCPSGHCPGGCKGGQSGCPATDHQGAPSSEQFGCGNAHYSYSKPSYASCTDCKPCNSCLTCHSGCNVCLTCNGYCNSCNRCNSCQGCVECQTCVSCQSCHSECHEENSGYDRICGVWYAGSRRTLNRSGKGCGSHYN